MPPEQMRNDPVDTIDAECRTLLPSLGTSAACAYDVVSVPFFPVPPVMDRDLRCTAHDRYRDSDCAMRTSPTSALCDNGAALVFDVNDFDETMRARGNGT